MSTHIRDYELPYDTHNRYDVTFNNDQIHTLVTHSPVMVDRWISENINNQTGLIGLDVEWRPSYRSDQNPVATLQLCTGPHCLIYQLLFTPNIPPSLNSLLANTSHTFVGVGIGSDLERLEDDHGLRVASTVDLGSLAAQKMGVASLRNAGLKQLAKDVLGVEVAKPKRVTMSAWDCETLSYSQVKYACVDAFLSYKIGSELYSRN